MRVLKFNFYKIPNLFIYRSFEPITNISSNGWLLINRIVDLFPLGYVYNVIRIKSITPMCYTLN